MSYIETTVGKINSTVISPHMAGVPSETPVATFTKRYVKMEEIEKLNTELGKLTTEINRLRDCLSVLSSVALANVEMSKGKVEGV